MPGQIAPSRISTAEEGKSTRLESRLHLLAPLILILLNLYCYRHTINGYFLADDFVHVAYLADVFNGHPLRLLENFTGNWMQAWGTQFYRPLISLSLALDYGLGNGNALPFHVSNTIYHIAASVFLYYSSCRLLVAFPVIKARICALAAALFFTACPLHTEVVSWVIGRVDGLCLALFLASFYMYLRHKQDGGRIWFGASLFCFVLSLISKEMAVTLPPLLMLSTLTISKSGGFGEKLKEAFRDSRFYWGTLGAYFVVRWAALHTVSGGYDGSVGEGLSNSPLSERFKSLSKILFPFNAELISPYDRLVKNLVTIYKVGAGFLAARLLFFKLSADELKIIAFCIAWFLLSLAPTYQVFNISDGLMCSRFAYFATAPFCLLLATLLSPLWPEQNTLRKQQLSKWMTGIALVLIAGLAAIYVGTTTKNNRSWADAGKQVRQFRAALAEDLGKADAQSKMVLLNVPQRMEGAHMIYNGAMLSVLLSEPLSRPSIADRVLSFEPATYGDAEFINASRLRRLLKEHPDYHYRYWDMDSARLLDLKLDTNPVNLDFALLQLDAALKKSDASGRLTINSPPLELNAASCDFVICTMRLPEQYSASQQSVNLYWSSSKFPEFSVARCIMLPARLDGKTHSYIFPVSERKSWFAGETIRQLRLQIPAGTRETNSPSITSLAIVSSEKLMPTIAAQDMADGADGISRISNPVFKIACDGSKIPNCASIDIELSKPNSWFEHYSGTFRDTTFSKNAYRSLSKIGKQASFEFSRKDFPAPAYYQIRAFALDKKGNPIGFCSDPINLQID